MNSVASLHTFLPPISCVIGPYLTCELTKCHDSEYCFGITRYISSSYHLIPLRTSTIATTTRSSNNYYSNNNSSISSKVVVVVVVVIIILVVIVVVVVVVTVIVAVTLILLLLIVVVVVVVVVVVFSVILMVAAGMVKSLLNTFLFFVGILSKIIRMCSSFHLML